MQRGVPLGEILAEQTYDPLGEVGRQLAGFSDSLVPIGVAMLLQTPMPKAGCREYRSDRAADASHGLECRWGKSTRISAKDGSGPEAGDSRPIPAEQPNKEERQ